MDINIFICLVLLVLGLCLGSFAGASVWRLRAKQLVEDERDGEVVDKVEYKRLKKITGKSLTSDHSQCLHCSYSLKWYDLIPLVSWLSLGGKCRKCKKAIGTFEPIIEIGVAIFFVASYVFWPYPLTDFMDISRLVIWLISGVGLAILFAYDSKWSLLPDSVNFSVIGLGVIFAGATAYRSSSLTDALCSIGGSVLILSGLYLFLYIISKGKWIGFGDIKLGLGLALLLSDWKLAFIALFVANLSGCIIIIPGMISGKIKRNAHIPFGPLLIFGMFIAGLFGVGLIDPYLFGLFYTF